MKKSLLTVLFLSILILSGCVKQIRPAGMTIAIPASKITESLEHEFPISQNTQYGKVILKNPRALMQKGSDRITAGATVLFSNELITEQSGTIQISGKPYFDATTGNVYLKEPDIEKLEANGYKIASYMRGSIKQIIMPIINEVFRKVPIYKVNTSTIKGSLVKNVRVEDGSLLVQFGL